MIGVVRPLLLRRAWLGVRVGRRGRALVAGARSEGRPALRRSLWGQAFARPDGLRSGRGRSPRGPTLGRGRSLSERAGRPERAGGRVGAFGHAARLHEGGGVSVKKLDGSKGCASILPFAPARAHETHPLRRGQASQRRGLPTGRARWPEAKRPLRACSGAVAGRADSLRPGRRRFHTGARTRRVRSRGPRSPACWLAE